MSSTILNIDLSDEKLEEIVAKLQFLRECRFMSEVRGMQLPAAIAKEVKEYELLIDNPQDFLEQAKSLREIIETKERTLVKPAAEDY
jgi:hypothetical protein